MNDSFKKPPLTSSSSSASWCWYFWCSRSLSGQRSSRRWQFPKWFGCVLHDHDSLAAGLIGVAGALLRHGLHGQRYSASSQSNNGKLK